MARISRFLQFHLKLFQAIGYNNLPLDDNRRGGPCQISRWLPLWSCLLMVLFNMAAFTALFSKEEFLFTGDKFGYFNDILKVVFGNIAVTSCYFESVWKRSDLREFWKCYDKLQSKSNRSGTMPMPTTKWRQEFWQNRRFLLIFYGVVCCEPALSIIFIHIKEMIHHLTLFWSLYTPFIVAVHLRNMQFIFYIELLRQELVKLKQDLHLMVDYSRFQAYGTGFKGFEKFLRSKILEKQKDYQLIYEMFENFQSAFGISILTVLLMIYVRVLVDSYFNYYMVYRAWNNADIIMLIPACMHIPIFLIFSKNCMDVVQYISLNLHCIISQFNNQNDMVTVQLQNFSLQILHQKICINGIGITRMDGYMLARAIGSITTYMIFFIQFMPKFTNMST